jgi:hypothetical protein
MRQLRINSISLQTQLDVSTLLGGENIGLATGIQKLTGIQQSYGSRISRKQTNQALLLEKRNHALQKTYGLNVVSSC